MNRWKPSWWYEYAPELVNTFILVFLLWRAFR